MPAHRVVLFKTRPGTTLEQKQAFIDACQAMKDKLPGLISLELGTALDMERTKGYDMGIFLTVESKDHLRMFAESAGHLKLHDMREAMSEDSLAFNLEF